MGGFSLVWVMLSFILHLEKWAVNNTVSKIWVGMSTTIVHLLEFKFQSHLQKRRLWISLHQWSKLIPKKGHQKFLTFHLPFCIFCLKMLQLNCHPEYFGIYFSWWNHQIRFKMVHSSPQNAKFGVHQFQVCYLNTTH